MVDLQSVAIGLAAAVLGVVSIVYQERIYGHLLLPDSVLKAAAYLLGAIGILTGVLFVYVGL